MKKITKLLFAVLFVASSAMYGQTLTGTVVDSENEPLPGADVIVVGTNKGDSTDFEGKFSLNVDAGTGKVKISFVGFNTVTLDYTVAQGETVNLGKVQLIESAEGLDEIVITQVSFAIDRKTPVAVSTIRADEIALKLGTQEFPEILKSTPGVYATKSGGGYGDGRINLRGFGSENIGTLINGIPVNDMENGRVYWSNWAGLGDVTSAMQVQRGLGASKVAVPSIGGTINIITKSTDAVVGGNIIATIGNDGYQKYGVTLSTGLMDNGFAATVSAAKISGNGYVDGTEFSGYNYFINLSKIINESHKISFTAFGAQQTHGQRYNRKTIAEYRATEQGGKRFNPDWGYKFGQVEHMSYNFYHKPQMSLNHYWNINDKTTLSNVLYASFGNGGGRRDAGSKIGSAEYRLGDIDQPIDFDRIVEENKVNGALGSTDIFSASRNSHKWYGLLSTLKTELSENLILSGGLDARYYVGSHWYEVTDLLGGEYFLNTNSRDNTQALKVGDRYNKDYDTTVINAGLFAQIEYTPREDIALFLSTAISNTSYSKEDFMRYAATDPDRKSETADFLGYSIKGGANYNIDDNHNIFANIGYFSKAPFLTRNVFLSTSSTDLNADALNEKVFSAEIGYGYRSGDFSANVNIYRTSWIDKSLTGSISNPDPTADRLTYNVAGLDALHQGIEIDFRYNITEKLKATGMVSLGDWKWKNDTTGQVFDESGDEIEEINVYAKDLKVTDAAQTTFALGLRYDLLPKTLIFIDYNYAANLYAQYRITDRGDPTNREDSWKVPSFGLFDLGFRHGFKIGDFDTSITAKMNNIFNLEYVADANDGSTSNYDTALVYYGAGRTFSVGMKFNF